MLLTQIPQKLVGILVVQRISRRECDIQLLFQLFDHVKPLPRRREIHLVALLSLPSPLRVEGDRGAARQLLDQARNHALRHVHQVVHVGIGHVKLANGEFGIVRHVDLLVSEHSTNFKHSVQTTDDQLLQVELGGDSHKQVELEIVVVRDKWLGGGSSCNHRHHGRLDFQESKRVEVLSDVVDDLGSGDECVSSLRIHDQVEVSLSVSRLLVDDTFSSGELVQAWGEELELGHG